MESTDIAIIIPCFNEAPRIARLIDDLAPHVAELGSVSVVLINDGSSDSTLDELRRLSADFEWVNWLSFTRNFGKEAAMLAGIDWAASRGAAALIMDADGQHPPAVAREMIDAYRAGSTHIVAQRNRADEARSRRLLARVAYGVMSRITQVDLVNGQGDFRLLAPDLVGALSALPERNRFSKGLYSWLGDPDLVLDFEPVAELEQRPSSWSLSALLNYSIDGITSFNDRPLRTILLTGIATGVATLGYLVIMLIVVARDGVEVPGYLTTIFAVTILGSLQLISLGVIGEYVGRILVEVKDRPAYLVRERSE